MAAATKTGAGGRALIARVAIPAWAVAWGALFAPACAQTADDEARRRDRIEALVGELRADYPDVKTIAAAALMGALASEPAAKDGFVLVDVRTDREREVSTLPGAISRDLFESRIAEFAGRTVVAYCTIGARSSSYARRMAGRGVEVLNLEGSVLAWTHLGGEFEDADGAATRRVHVSGRRWNLVARGYEAVW